MVEKPFNARDIAVGTPVRAANGELLGRVREAHPHYVLVSREGEHGDFDVPVHAVIGFADGALQVSVNPWSVTEVDDVETAHRLNEDGNAARG